MKDKPGGDNREDRLQAHENGCYYRVGIFLTDDLESICYAAAHDAGIKECGRGCHDVSYHRVFKYEHEDQGDHGSYDKFHKRQLHAADALGKEAVDQDDLDGVEHCADQGQDITGIKGCKVLRVDTEEEQTDKAKHYRHPDHKGYFFL